MLNNTQINDLLGKIDSAGSVVISTHKGPDGDAIGSSMGLKLALESRCEKVYVVVQDEFPDFLKWLDPKKEIVVVDKEVDRSKELIEKADLIFCLDYNDFSRAGSIGAEINEASAYKVLVDHHEEPKVSLDINYHDATASSTAELIYCLLEELSLENNLEGHASKCLYTGIVTDTGSLRYPSVKAKTHLIIASLIEKGMEHHLVHEALFDDNSLNRLALNGYAVSSKLELLPNAQIAVISLTSNELQKYEAKKGDTEGLVNKALSIKGIQMAIFAREDKEIIKISFRSKGSVFVNELARDHFSGGGHKYAAGGKSDLNMEDTLEKIRVIAPKYV